MNNDIFFFFYNLTHKSVFFDNLVIFLAVYGIHIIITLAFLLLIVYLSVQTGRKISLSKDWVSGIISYWRSFALLCLSGGLAYFFSKFLKFIFHTPRPFEVFLEIEPLFLQNGYAFPSGHTMISAAVATAIFLLHKKTGYAFLFFALLIGLSRIAVGVHFPIDIFGGFVLGVSISYIIAYFLKIPNNK